MSQQDEEWAAYVAGLNRAQDATDKASDSLAKNSKDIVAFVDEVASAWDKRNLGR